MHNRAEAVFGRKNVLRQVSHLRCKLGNCLQDTRGCPQRLESLENVVMELSPESSWDEKTRQRVVELCDQSWNLPIGDARSNSG